MSTSWESSMTQVPSTHLHKPKSRFPSGPLQVPLALLVQRGALCGRVRAQHEPVRVHEHVGCAPVPGQPDTMLELNTWLWVKILAVQQREAACASSNVLMLRKQFTQAVLSACLGDIVKCRALNRSQHLKPVACFCHFLSNFQSQSLEMAALKMLRKLEQGLLATVLCKRV